MLNKHKTVLAREYSVPPTKTNVLVLELLYLLIETINLLLNCILDKTESSRNIEMQNGLIIAALIKYSILRPPV